MQRKTGDLIYTLGELGGDTIARLHELFAPGLLTSEELVDWWKHPRSTSLLLSKERGDHLGILLFTALKRHISIDSVAIAEPHRRQGHGRRLLRQLLRTTGVEWFRVLTNTVADSNLSAHLWLKSVGFKAIRVLEGKHGEDDSYLFSWSRPRLCVSREGKL